MKKQPSDSKAEWYYTLLVVYIAFLVVVVTIHSHIKQRKAQRLITEEDTPEIIVIHRGDT